MHVDLGRIMIFFPFFIPLHDWINSIRFWVLRGPGFLLQSIRTYVYSFHTSEISFFSGDGYIYSHSFHRTREATLDCKDSL